jgi:N-acetylneuraminate synthase
LDECPVKLIAEIGCVHGGSEERAIMLCELACSSGADIIKSQKRNPEESVPALMKKSPHPNSFYSYGSNYLEHRKNLELDISSHEKMKNVCEKMGKVYACSVWDITSAKEVISICPDYIKIPSACNLNFDLIDFILSNFSRKLHISLGMLSFTDRERLFDKYSSEKNIIYYHCTSEYPCKFENLYLNEIKYLKERFVSDVGFSNHGYGIASDMVAMAFGASFIERHFVDDRTFRHTDAAASLEPNGLKQLKRDIVNVYSGFKYRPYSISEEEQKQLVKMRY